MRLYRLPCGRGHTRRLIFQNLKKLREAKKILLYKTGQQKAGTLHCVSAFCHKAAFILRLDMKYLAKYNKLIPFNV